MTIAFTTFPIGIATIVTTTICARNVTQRRKIVNKYDASWICAWPGCTEKPRKGRYQRLCMTHFARRYNNQDPAKLGTLGKKQLTDEQRAEIDRRYRNFENPLKLAKEFNVTKQTILNTVRKMRNA
jgi:hypothetical protein